MTSLSMISNQTKLFSLANVYTVQEKNNTARCPPVFVCALSILLLNERIWNGLHPVLWANQNDRRPSTHDQTELPGVFSQFILVIWICMKAMGYFKYSDQTTSKSVNTHVEQGFSNFHAKDPHI